MYICPVCRFDMDDPASDWNICPCCGTEFEYHDSGRTHEELREVWIASGAKWWSKFHTPPLGWNAQKQLGKVEGAGRIELP